MREEWVARKQNNITYRQTAATWSLNQYIGNDERVRLFALHHREFDYGSKRWSSSLCFRDGRSAAQVRNILCPSFGRSNHRAYRNESTGNPKRVICKNGGCPPYFVLCIEGLAFLVITGNSATSSTYQLLPWPYHRVLSWCSNSYGYYPVYGLLLLLFGVRSAGQVITVGSGFGFCIS